MTLVNRHSQLGKNDDEKPPTRLSCSSRDDDTLGLGNGLTKLTENR